MQSFTNVEYDHKPNNIEVYKSGVDVITKCLEIKKRDEQSDNITTVWICDVDRYTLLEYIYIQQERYNAVVSKLAILDEKAENILKRIGH